MTAGSATLLIGLLFGVALTIAAALLVVQLVPLKWTIERDDDGEDRP